MQDYNFGSLIRTDARSEYGEQNTIFGECLILDSYIHANSGVTIPSHTNTGMFLLCPNILALENLITIMPKFYAFEVPSFNQFLVMEY